MGAQKANTADSSDQKQPVTFLAQSIHDGPAPATLRALGWRRRACIQELGAWLVLGLGACLRRPAILGLLRLSARLGHLSEESLGGMQKLVIVLPVAPVGSK